MSGPPVTESEPETLPESVFKTILEIKGAFGKYSDEEIYTLLKECNMDPDQATEKLQFLETFQDVKRKERKLVVKKGRRGSDNHYYYNNNNHDDEWQNQQYHAPRQENRSEPRFSQRKNGYQSQPRGGAPKKESNNQEKNGYRAKGAPPKAPKNESIVSSVGAPPKGEESISRPATTKNPSPPAKSNLDKNRPKEQLKLSSCSNSGPGPTPASTPTNNTPTVPRQQQQQQPPSKSSLGKGPLPSPSDPVVEQSLIPPRNHHGAIQRETSRNQKDGTIVVDFLGKPQSVVFPNQVLAPEDFKTNILFGSIGTLDTFLEKSSNIAENEPRPAEPQSPPPQVPVVTSQVKNSDPIFNPPKQEVLPPVSRSSETPQQEKTKLTTSPPPLRAQSSGPNLQFLHNSFSSQFLPYYSPMYMPQVPAQNVMLSHGGYANQLMTGVARAKYQYGPPREENKEESMYYNNLPQAYPPPPTAQGGLGFQSLYHQNLRPHVQPQQQQQQQMGGDQSSYAWSQLQNGSPFRNPNREN